MSLTMQKPEDDTVVCVLQSSNNDSAYRNTSNIVHEMYPPYKFPQRRYEVGLRKVSYFPNKRATGNRVKKEGRKVTRVITRSVKFHEKLAPPGPLFPGYAPPEVIKEVTVVKKEEEDMIHFINRFNDDIGPDLNVALYSSGSATQRVILVKFEPSDVQEILLFSPGLAKILGHRRQQFHPGRYVGNDVVTNDDYKRLNVNTDLTIKIVKFPYKESMITLHQQFDAVRSFQKGEQAYGDFFAAVSRNVALDGYKLSFTFDEYNRVTMKVEVSVITDPRNYVHIPLEIRDCLGFQEDQFPVGTYTSAHPINLTRYNAIPSDLDLYFRFRAYSWLYQMMKEPKSLGIRDVLDDLNESFTEMRSQEFVVEFYYDDGDLVVNDIPPDVEIIFPKSLTKYFGIPDNTKISNGRRIPLAVELVHEEEEIEYVEENEPTPSEGEPTKLLICSDIVKEMPYGKRLVNLLREIPLTYDLNKEVEVDFNPVQYLPLTSAQVNQIRINFMDEYLRPVELTNKATSVTLEFRPKF